METVLDKIHVYENAFSPEQFDEGLLWLKRIRWSPNQSMKEDGIDGAWVSKDPNSYSPTIRRFWGAGQHLHKEEFFNKICLDRIKELTGEQNLEINHVLINGQTACQDGNPHYDSEVESAYTFIWFLNPYWDYRWGGQFIAFDRYLDYGTNEVVILNENKFVTIFPMPNAAIFFPSNILHFAFGPTKDCSGMRVSVAFKLHKKVEE